VPSSGNEMCGVKPSANSQAHLLFRIEFNKRSNSGPPIVIKPGFLLVIMQTGLSFQTGLCFIADPKCRCGRKPFRSSVQVIKSFCDRDEILMFIPRRENSFIEFPVDIDTDEVIPA